jgi:RNA polymerase sigma factor (sigma-70 family)
MIVSQSRTNTLNPEELIKGCLEGNQRAWDDLVHQYGRLVYSIARRYGLRESDAEDAFQMVFTSLHRQISTIRDPSRLSGWLIKTTHRECWRLSRHRGRECALSDRWCDPAEPTAELICLWEKQQIIREALKRLAPRDRELMQMLFLESPPEDYETIARRLHMKPGSIGPTRARCFKKLERILIELGFDAAEGLPGTLGSRERPRPVLRVDEAAVSLN